MPFVDVDNLLRGEDPKTPPRIPWMLLAVTVIICMGIAYGILGQQELLDILRWVLPATSQPSGS